MIGFSNAKINVGLYVTGKRKDGFHNLESLFLPIGLQDVIELIPSEVNELCVYGRAIPGDSSKNSCLTALQLMQERFGIGAYKILLYKTIPTGAGLGGGSSNASCTLRLLNTLENLGLTNTQLEELALEIGSDNPFFIENRAKYVAGRGELMEDCALNLSGVHVVLIYPNMHRGTAEAYESVAFEEPPMNLKTLTKQEFLNVNLTNGFQSSFIEQFPETEQLVEQLYNAGADYVSLSGSGSCFYGLFFNDVQVSKELENFVQEKNYELFTTKIL